jgi:hypothetical protein
MYGYLACDKPTTVKALGSWCGAYKHLKVCIPQYSSLLAGLATAVAGKELPERVTWTAELEETFSVAQSALYAAKSVTIPRHSDRLIITNDGAVRKGGIGSVLYVLLF